MNTLKIARRYDLQWPAGWDEVTGEQMADLTELLHNKSYLPSILAEAFLILCNMRKKPLWVRLAWQWLIGYDTKFDCVQSCKWVLKANDQTHNPLPFVRIGRTKLYGPLDSCRGLTFLEFIEADMHYLEYFRTMDEADKGMIALNKLVAILYRDKNPNMPDIKNGKIKDRKKLQAWNGDPRCAYSSGAVRFRKIEIKRLEVKYKLTIFLFYNACHQQWEKMFDQIFERANSTEGGDGDWAGALQSLAGGSLNVEQMANVPALMALKDLNQRLKNAEKK